MAYDRFALDVAIATAALSHTLGQRTASDSVLVLSVQRVTNDPPRALLDTLATTPATRVRPGSASTPGAGHVRHVEERAMGVMGMSGDRYDIIAFTERSPDTREERVPVIVVLRGTEGANNGRRREDMRALLASEPQSAGWTNGRDVVRYRRSDGLVSVAGQTVPRDADGRTTIVLADARHPEMPAERVAIAEVAAPVVEPLGTIALLWRSLHSWIVHRTDYRTPQERWFDQIRRLPAVEAFLRNDARLAR